MPSTVFRMPQIASSGIALNDDEISFFRENGFLVKTGLVDIPSCERALSRVWDYVMQHVVDMSDKENNLDRNDRSTWLNPSWRTMPPAPKSGFYEGRQPIFAYGIALKLHRLGSEDFLVDLLPRNPKVRSIAELLLSSSLRRSTRTRGVYALFPRERTESAKPGRLGPHTDRVCQQLNTCLYLDDVLPRGGGFTVYPGSHRIMYRAHERDANWSPLDSFPDRMNEVVSTIKPLELIANKGDVIFWHGRTVHTAGIHHNEDIRWAVFGDYCEDRPVLTDDEHRAAGQYEWFKDTELYRTDWPVDDDMWAHWNIGSATVTDSVSSAAVRTS